MKIEDENTSLEILRQRKISIRKEFKTRAEDNEVNTMEHYNNADETFFLNIFRKRKNISNFQINFKLYIIQNCSD